MIELSLQTSVANIENQHSKTQLLKIISKSVITGQHNGKKKLSANGKTGRAPEIPFQQGKYSAYCKAVVTNPDIGDLPP